MHAPNWYKHKHKQQQFASELISKETSHCTLILKTMNNKCSYDLKVRWTLSSSNTRVKYLKLRYISSSFIVKQQNRLWWAIKLSFHDQHNLNKYQFVEPVLVLFISSFPGRVSMTRKAPESSKNKPTQPRLEPQYHNHKVAQRSLMVSCFFKLWLDFVHTWTLN